MRGRKQGQDRSLPSHLAPSQHSCPLIRPWAETPVPCTHQGGSPAHRASWDGPPHPGPPCLPPGLPTVRSLLCRGPGPGLEPAGAGAGGLWRGQVRAAPSPGSLLGSGWGGHPAISCSHSPRMPPGLRSTSCPRRGILPSTSSPASPAPPWWATPSRAAAGARRRCPVSSRWRWGSPSR